MIDKELEKKLRNIKLRESITDFTSKAIVHYMLDKDIVIDEVVRTIFLELLYDNDIRVCDVCSNIMKEGYCIEGGFSYRCSDECLCSKEGNLETDISPEEWEELVADGEGDSYWTEWDCDEEIYNNVNKIVAKYPELGYKVDGIYYPEIL